MQSIARSRPPRLGSRYDGSGPTTLAIVLEALLDDIGRARVYRGTPDVSRWLLRIAQKKWRSGTVLTRAQLSNHLERAGRERTR